MKVVVISPEADAPGEHATLAALLAAGLERYHVRKPQWSREKLAAWLGEIAPIHRSSLVSHQHHELAVEYGCGGVHFKDEAKENAPHGLDAATVDAVAAWRSRGLLVSGSCHGLAAVQAAVGCFDAVFFSPVFSSISKRGYGPSPELASLSAWLQRRTQAERRTEVIALGGVAPENVARCAELGFDGVAVLGALWSSADPLDLFSRLKRAAEGVYAA
jgi:thiamine-phosphate pyrophosphorylase